MLNDLAEAEALVASLSAQLAESSGSEEIVARLNHARGRAGLLRVQAERGPDKLPQPQALHARDSGSLHMFRLHYREQIVELGVSIPVASADEADELADEVATQLKLPLTHEVVAVTRRGDPAFPPLPPLLLHCLLERSSLTSMPLVSEEQTATVPFDADVLVRPAVLRAAALSAPPLPPIPIDSLLPAVVSADGSGGGSSGATPAALELLRRLHVDGVPPQLQTRALASPPELILGLGLGLASPPELSACHAPLARPAGWLARSLACSRP